ncbi:MAG: hypothetical protein ACXIU5_16895 [Halomonadaceae bacterium]|jgi:hypothetical protein
MKKWLTFDRLSLFLMIGLPAIFSIIFMSLYVDVVLEDKKFYQYGVVTSGTIIGERVCGDGTRFGHQYCYRVRFTTQSGEELVFSAAGRTSYQVGFYILPNSVRVQYLPDRPSYARLVGEESHKGFFLLAGLGGLGMAVVISIGMFGAIRFRKKTDEDDEEQESLLLSGDVDGAIQFTKSIPNDERRKILLGNLIVRLYEQGEDAAADDALGYLLDIFQKELSSFKRDSMLYMLVEKLLKAGRKREASPVIMMIEHENVKPLLVCLDVGCVGLEKPSGK